MRASMKCPMRHLAITGMSTADWMAWIIAGSEARVRTYLVQLTADTGMQPRIRLGAARPDIRVFHRGSDGALWVGATDGLWRYARGELARPVGLGRRRFGGAAFGFHRHLVLRRGARRRLALVDVLALERRVLHQHAVDLLVELDRGELQQTDRLLQLGRQRQVLRQSKL